MKVILNKCYGGFNVSDKAYELYAKKKNIPLYRYERDYKGDIDIRKKIMQVLPTTTAFVDYFTKDFGDYFKPTKEDWQHELYLSDNYRDDTTLIEVVEELGDEASGRHGKLVVVEIPDGMDYVIDNYDGIETLHEDVPTW